MRTIDPTSTEVKSDNGQLGKNTFDVTCVIVFCAVILIIIIIFCPDIDLYIIADPHKRFAI